MNTIHLPLLSERYALPAFAAAAFHAVLLFGFTPTPRAVLVEGPEDVVKLKPIPAAVLELLRPPEPEKGPSVEPVQPLAGGPVRPELEDRTVPTPSAFQLPPTERLIAPRTDVALDKIPKFGGTGGPGEATGPGLAHARVFTLGDLDRTPRPKVQVAPDYPAALRAAGIAGSALIEFDVDASGAVVTARVVQETAREFGDAAVRAILKWRFEPGRKDGRAVPFRMVVPVGFTLGAD
jgi:protein TonB